jgi:L-alanine-DL-glutamate epimerase-like enolase superfamily enzyme
MELIIRAYDLKLKHTFTISRESIDFQPSLIVELSDGVSGFGEATSNPYYNTSVPIMIEDLNKIRNIIETSDGDTRRFLEKSIPI